MPPARYIPPPEYLSYLDSVSLYSTSARLLKSEFCFRFYSVTICVAFPVSILVKYVRCAHQDARICISILQTLAKVLEITFRIRGAKKKQNLLHSLVDIVHHFVVSAARVDSGDDAGCQAVHQLAQDDSVPQRILKGEAGREAFPNHRLDPVLRLALLLWLALSGHLSMGE